MRYLIKSKTILLFLFILNSISYAYSKENLANTSQSLFDYLGKLKNISLTLSYQDKNTFDNSKKSERYITYPNDFFIKNLNLQFESYKNSNPDIISIVNLENISEDDKTFHYKGRHLNNSSLFLGYKENNFYKDILSDKSRRQDFNIDWRFYLDKRDNLYFSYLDSKQKSEKALYQFDFNNPIKLERFNYNSKDILIGTTQSIKVGTISLDYSKRDVGKNNIYNTYSTRIFSNIYKKTRVSGSFSLSKGDIGNFGEQKTFEEKLGFTSSYIKYLTLSGEYKYRSDKDTPVANSYPKKELGSKFWLESKEFKKVKIETGYGKKYIDETTDNHLVINEVTSNNYWVKIRLKPIKKIKMSASYEDIKFENLPNSELQDTRNLLFDRIKKTNVSLNYLLSGKLNTSVSISKQEKENKIRNIDLKSDNLNLSATYNIKDINIYGDYLIDKTKSNNSLVSTSLSDSNIYSFNISYPAFKHTMDINYNFSNSNSNGATSIIETTNEIRLSKGISKNSNISLLYKWSDYWDKNIENNSNTTELFSVEFKHNLK